MIYGDCTLQPPLSLFLHQKERNMTSSSSSPISRSPTEPIRHRHCPSYHYDSRSSSGRSDQFYHLLDPPPLETISRCTSGFIRGTSTLLYLLPEYETIELINSIYHPGTGHSRASNSKMCELLSVAAMGSQYERVGREVQMKLFRSAKWYLDSGFGRDGDSLRRMRTSMLIGWFLIFEKSFGARDYIGGGFIFFPPLSLSGADGNGVRRSGDWARAH